jgi:hypothetical protein
VRDADVLWGSRGLGSAGSGKNRRGIAGRRSTSPLSSALKLSYMSENVCLLVHLCVCAYDLTTRMP